MFGRIPSGAARGLNQRPGKTLGLETPAGKLHASVASNVDHVPVTWLRQASWRRNICRRNYSLGDFASETSVRQGMATLSRENFSLSTKCSLN
jgi:hypothetical protein